MNKNKRYLLCCVSLIIAFAQTVTTAQSQSAESSKERDLIVILRSDAPKSKKAITCKQLAIYGTDQAVPALAPLLEDKELSSWARIALEAIPGTVADAALRDATGKVQGRLLIGIINSIAVRRDAQAVKILAQKLGDTNADVASAAAVALGHIGGEQAAAILMNSLVIAPSNVRSAGAEGCIICAEGLLANGRTADAVKLYDKVRQADVPDQRHLEAIRGAILARQLDGIPLLIEQLQSKDKKRLGVGLRSARELGGQKVTEALAGEMAELSPDRRPLLLLAIADRKDSAVLPTVLKAAQSGSKDLRITAINILIRLGDVSCVPVLLGAAMEEDAQLEQAAKETLIRLPGKEVDSALVDRLPKAQGSQRRILIELVGQRQIEEALPIVVSSLKDADAGVRGAAIGTIEIIGRDQQAGDLVQLLLKTDNSSERKNIRKALMSICGRFGIKCISHLRPLLQSEDKELHMMGLRASAIIGGPDALANINSAIQNADPTVQDEAVRILSTWPNNWPQDSDAGKTLLSLAGSTQKMLHKVLAQRGYLQYIRGNKKLSNDQKVSEVTTVLKLISRPEEKLQAIAVLGEAPCANALDLLTTLANDTSLTEGVYSSMVSIADQDIQGISRERRRQVLQTVTAKSKNDSTRKRALKSLNGIR